MRVTFSGSRSAAKRRKYIDCAHLPLLGDIRRMIPGGIVVMLISARYFSSSLLKRIVSCLLIPSVRIWIDSGSSLLFSSAEVTVTPQYAA